MHTLHRLFLASLRMATKLIDDHYCGNEWFGKVGGGNVSLMLLVDHFGFSEHCRSRPTRTCVFAAHAVRIPHIQGHL